MRGSRMGMRLRESLWLLSRDKRWDVYLRLRYRWFVLEALERKFEEVLVYMNDIPTTIVMALHRDALMCYLFRQF
jgi:hypothetical protein